MINLDKFCNLMRNASERQRDLLLHVIQHILSAKKSPLQILFIAPAGCRKTFVIKLIIELCNQFSNNDGFCNAYITCAFSTGKAVVDIDRTAVRTALKISLSKLLPLSMEMAQQYRYLFEYVEALVIDEISMIDPDLLNQIDLKLKQITGNFKNNFGGFDIILIEDLRQLAPVKAETICNQPKQRMFKPLLWRGLKFYKLTHVLQQMNIMFLSILTKIGNGSILDDDELSIIESRFFTKEQVALCCPNGVRLFHENASANEYNVSILQQNQNKIVSIAVDVITGCTNHEQEVLVRQELRKMSLIDTGGLPYEIIFVIGKPYIITTNIDVADGLTNGATGKLAHIEQNEQNEVTRVWLIFPDKKTGAIAKSKAAGYVVKRNIDKNAVSITRRTTSVHVNSNKTIVGKRNHFPIIPRCAMTIHKSQGDTYDQIVYEYSKTHSIQLLYAALSRVTSIRGLYMCNRNDDLKFYHGRRIDPLILHLQEFKRLSSTRLTSLQGIIADFMKSREGLTLKCQSLKKDSIIKRSNFLLLSETWIPNEEEISLPNFNCIAKFKRGNVRPADVALNKNNNISRISTFNIDLTIYNATNTTVAQGFVGDLCVSQIVLDDGRQMLVAIAYISLDQKIEDIISFLHRGLFPYSVSATDSRISNENSDELPMILAGNFNVNFTRDELVPLITFLQQEFQLCINNNPRGSATRSTEVDVVFIRHLDNVTCNAFVAYFSYHQSIEKLIPSETSSSVNITDVTNKNKL